MPLVETMGRRLAELSDRGARLEEAAPPATSDAATRRQIEGLMETTDAALDATEIVIASTPAETLAEAAIQIMVAVRWSDFLRSPGENINPDELHERMERMLLSALAVIVQEGGVDLAEFGSAFYLAPRWASVQCPEAMASDDRGAT